MHLPENNLLFKVGDRFNIFLTLAFATTGVVAVCAAIVLFIAGQGRSTVPWLVVAGSLVFVMTPPSAWLWHAFPALARVQFPWRGLVLFELSACMLLALVMQARPTGSRHVFQVLTVSLVVMVSMFLLGRGFFGSEAFLSSSQETEYAMIAIRADAPEYLPSCGPTPRPDELVSGQWYRAVDRALAARGPNTLPVFYFPFLTVTADGSPVPIACDPATGFITAQIDEGAEVDIVSAALPTEKLAYAISAASLVVLLAGVWFARRRRVF